MMANEFLYWEQNSRDTIDFKMIYVDIAGDIVTGLLLSQIIYWNLPNKEGKTKLRVKSEGELWLAKGRSDWYQECRITEKQFDRSIKILESKGIVTTKLKKFNGSPTKHIKLNIQNLVNEISNINSEGKMDFTQRVKTKLPKSEIGFSSKGKNDFDQKVNSLTENTTYITTETTTKESVEVDSHILNLQSKIKNKTNLLINEKSIIKLLEEKGEDKIMYYADNWNKIVATTKGEVGGGLFIDAVIKEYSIPKKNENNIHSDVPNMMNFKQRDYTADELEKFYYKTEENN